MTLIQCFCPTFMENLAGCLRLQPDKLILLGDAEQMQAPAERYRAIAAARGIAIQVELCPLQQQNVTQIAQSLADILGREAECVIDLTGCDEMVALAVGAVMVGLEHTEKISVQRYDFAQDKDIDCDGDGLVQPGTAAWLTVEELISLYGGSIHPDSYQPPRNCDREEADKLWSIVAQAPKRWNRRIAVLREFESRSYSDREVILPLDQLRHSISDFSEKEEILLELLEQLRRNGIIRDRSHGDFLQYSYTSDWLRYCMEKAGNVLEVKTLLEARDFFRDSRMSVSIDWDGVIHQRHEKVPDTRNEMDIIATQGLTPLFISCKNGDIGDEELYKLHTVATRFGGPYARKMLIATDLDRKNAAADRAFLQRAWDMDIYVVAEGAELTKEEWTQAFETAMR